MLILFTLISDGVHKGLKVMELSKQNVNLSKVNLMNSQLGNRGKVFTMHKVSQCLFNRLNIFLENRGRIENCYP